ncbi:LytR/AlgR family response regulator transcription factor [Ideonella paludis]|uniref:LytR/AlgR family response regulator transcription factor n=1 Tax=Ideonella paludis TaxID=1233411 RepID=UPI0028732B37|nr:LytTR family DNA-binding domain-containing protein [Ideonella paludis]
MSVEPKPTRLRVLIVDDEPLARMRLRSLLADCGVVGVEVVGEAGSAPEALHVLSITGVDLLLLDIHMPGLNGLEVARRLREQAQREGNPAAPAVVFVTAHAEHALDAFELNACDYLTKPVRRQRLQEALQRVAQRLGHTFMAPPTTAAPPDKVLVVSDRGRILRIPFSELVSLKAEMKYVTLRTLTHTYVLDDALVDLEQRLGDAAVRIHRSAVVAKAAIRALEKRALPGAEDGDANESWAVHLAPTDEWLPVSRRQLAAVREALVAPA